MPSWTLAPDAAIDLQLHTTYSDGVWSAGELLDYVAGEGFALVAVTDHDRTDTPAEIQRLATQHHPDLHVLVAAEMSSSWDGELTDILCFGFDPAHNALAPLAESIRRRQLENVRETYAAIVCKGYRFPRQREVLAARDGTHDGEPRQFDDLITLLREHGYGDDMKTAFAGAGFRWITEDPAAIVEAAHHSGAVCLIAHPGRGDGFAQFDGPQLDRLRAAAPIDGLEIYHPSHTAEAAAAYLAYAHQHDLLISTGSDAHGKPEQMPIKYRAEISRALLERLGITVR